MNVRDSFIEQAEACQSLGSPFTASLLRLLAENLQRDTPIGAKVLGWSGDASHRTDAVGLRLAGALHALVLCSQSAALASVYPPNAATPNELWTAVEAAFNQHQSHILNWLDQAPQTNEVRRCCALMPTFLSLQDKFAMPLVLSELGASGGLNLNWDRFHLTLNGVEFGDPESDVRLQPDWTGPLPPNLTPDVIEKAGCDLNPLNPHTHSLRLRAYIWPDQFERLQRTNAAIRIAQGSQSTVEKSDAVPWLQQRLSTHRTGAVHVIYNSIAWQYFPPGVQASCRAFIEAAGAAATPKAPIAWVQMEADGGPKGAGLKAQLWPGGHTHNLGRAGFHGQWVDWLGFSDPACTTVTG